MDNCYLTCNSEMKNEEVHPRFSSSDTAKRQNDNSVAEDNHKQQAVEKYQLFCPAKLFAISFAISVSINFISQRKDATASVSCLKDKEHHLKYQQKIPFGLA